MDLFGITSLMIFFSSIGFALFLYSGNNKSHTNRAWLTASIAIALWGLSLYGVTYTTSEKYALWWQYLLDVSAIFIPVSYFNFISTLLNSKNISFRRVSLIFTILLAIFSFTPLFKYGVTMRYGVFWIDSGPYYWIFPAFFTLYTVLSLHLLIRTYLRNQDPMFKAQIRNTLIAGLIGFSGGLTNFFPQLFNVYPFGNYFVLLYVFFMSYGVLKYKLLSTKIVSAQLFSGALVLVFLFNLMRPDNLQDWIVKFLLFVLVVFFSLLLVRGVYKEIETRERIERLAKDLEDANVRLKELDQLKSEFVSIASHQIRAPITAIKGYASLIAEGNFGQLSPEMKEAIGVIVESSNGMAIMVDDFLNISRIEQGKMKYDYTVADLVRLVTQVYNELKQTAEKKELAFELEYDHTQTFAAYIDIGKIKQAVTNIIDNSIKYTPKGRVTIGMKKIGTKIDIYVRDTGVGIAPENIGKLFEKFSRARNGISTNVTGTGLGLYVVKQMVEAQKGRAWVESPGEGKGSTFHIELEAANQAQAATMVKK